MYDCLYSLVEDVVKIQSAGEQIYWEYKKQKLTDAK